MSTKIVSCLRKAWTASVRTVSTSMSIRADVALVMIVMTPQSRSADAYDGDRIVTVLGPDLECERPVRLPAGRHRRPVGQHDRLGDDAWEPVDHHGSVLRPGGHVQIGHVVLRRRESPVLSGEGGPLGAVDAVAVAAEPGADTLEALAE